MVKLVFGLIAAALIVRAEAGLGWNGQPWNRPRAAPAALIGQAACPDQRPASRVAAVHEPLSKPRMN